MALTKEQSHRLLEEYQAIALQVRNLEISVMCLEAKLVSLKESIGSFERDFRGMVNHNVGNGNG